MKGILEKFENSHIVKLMDIISKFGIIIALVTWFTDFSNRDIARENQRKEKIYRAWELINISTFQPLTTSRKDAVEDLISEDINLKYIELDEGAFENAEFKDARMMHASFWFSNLANVNFSGADLFNAFFNEANLKQIDFTGCNLNMAIFEKTKIEQTNLEKCDLKNTIFLDCDLSKSNSVTLEGLKKAIVFKNCKLPKSIDINELKFNFRGFYEFYLLTDNLVDDFDNFKKELILDSSYYHVAELIKLGFSMEIEE